ncbi:hypothetical protein D3C80_1313510 [compost metagenome]
MAIGFLDGYVDAWEVLVLRPGSEGHAQVVVTLHLLHGRGFVQADTTGNIADTVLLLGLDLHSRHVDRLGGLGYQGRQAHQYCQDSPAQG